jgi:DNA (cytosine-5)-methyltransferase 1
VNVGSLFAGIGGFDLGLARAGMHTRWQVELDPFCRDILAKRFPDAEQFADVREVGRASLGDVDLIAGGFPCVDFSVLGQRTGLGGEQSGLWTEFARIIGELRPHYVLVENVAGLLVRGMGDVLADLASLGYDAEWDCIPAAAIGSPHLRARIWLLAYPISRRHGAPDETIFAGRPLPQLRRWWADEPRLDRVANGVPRGVDRRRAIGNALAPQIAEWIGRRVMEVEYPPTNFDAAEQYEPAP